MVAQVVARAVIAHVRKYVQKRISDQTFLVASHSSNQTLSVKNVLKNVIMV